MSGQGLRQEPRKQATPNPPGLLGSQPGPLKPPAAGHAPPQQAGCEALGDKRREEGDWREQGGEGGLLGKGEFVQGAALEVSE